MAWLLAALAPDQASMLPVLPYDKPRTHSHRVILPPLFFFFLMLPVLFLIYSYWE